MEDFIPVSQPAFLGNERAYVDECMRTTWVSSIGRFIQEFEERFAAHAGVPHAISCMNGTVALHLALLGLGIGPGDEVLVPSLTYIASVNAIRYCGAEPVFVDSDRTTWNLDPDDLVRKITPRSKAVMAVHLYGVPAAMDAIHAVARRAGLAVVEDAAEATGASYRGHRVGGLGKVAAFSFFGNKILTCGEGGMVVTADEALGRHIRQLKGQGQDFERRYWFPIVGYNYRMTNIQAAIGLAQLEDLERHLAARDEIRGWYAEELAEIDGVVTVPAEPGRRDVCWLVSVVLAGHDEAGRDRVMAGLRARGIDSRPFFYPCHTMPPYAHLAADCPQAVWLAARGLSLPTWVGLRREQVRSIGTALRGAVAEARAAS